MANKQSVMIFDKDGVLKTGGLLPHNVYVKGCKDVSGDGPKAPSRRDSFRAVASNPRKKDDTTQIRQPGQPDLALTAHSAKKLKVHGTSALPGRGRTMLSCES